MNGDHQSGIDPLQLYRAYREYIVHEDNLVNHRVGWFIQLHSFLIASYMIIVAAIISSFFPEGTPRVAPETVQAIACVVLVALAAIGFVSSIAAGRSIRAAGRAIQHLEKRWNGLSEGFAERLGLPGIVGGGSSRNLEDGLRFHSLLPAALMILWVASLAIPIWFFFLATDAAH